MIAQPLTSSDKCMTAMNTNHQVNDKDIICGRGKAFSSHPGNKIFAESVRASLGSYLAASKRLDKSVVVSSIVNSMRERGSRFMKLHRKSAAYVELSETEAHEKTGHAIRDMIRNLSPTSCTRLVACENTRAKPLMGLSSLSSVCGKYSSTIIDRRPSIVDDSINKSLMEVQAVGVVEGMFYSNLIQQFDLESYKRHCRTIASAFILSETIQNGSNVVFEEPQSSWLWNANKSSNRKMLCEPHLPMIPKMRDDNEPIHSNMPLETNDLSSPLPISADIWIEHNDCTRFFDILND